MLRTRFLAWTFVVLCLPSITACRDSGGIQCSFSDPARLANSSWPKFQRDLQNTGAIAAPPLTGDVRITAEFHAPAGDTITTSPVLGNGRVVTEPTDARLYVGTATGTLYALDSKTLEPLQSTEFSFATAAPIRTTPLIASRQGQEALFFGNELGFVYGITQTGSLQPQVWPLNIGGAIGLSAALSPIDGTVYVASAANSLVAVCPNGIRRYASTSIAGFSSAPATTPTGDVVYGGDDRILRMERGDGFLQWAISLSAPLRASVVVEISSDASDQVAAIYAVDLAGRLFKVSPTGQLLYSTALANPETSPAAEAVEASPALAAGRLYVGTTSGNLLAIDTVDGVPAWSLNLGAPITGAVVVLLHPETRTVLATTTQGTIHAVADAGASPHMITSIDVARPIRLSPAISALGDRPVVFLADDQGRVVRIE